MRARERRRREQQRKEQGNPAYVPAYQQRVIVTPATPTWPQWIDAYSTTTSTQVWTNWNPDSTTASIYSTDIWPTWTNRADLYTYAPRVVDTPERVAERQREAEVRRVAAEARRVEEEFAKERAEKLLMEHLDDHQRKEWIERGEIHVNSQRGRRYCIKRGRQHNVFEVDRNGRRVRELCGHVSEAVPNADNVLAQKLALELMEDDFLRTCNIWDLTRDRELVSRSGLVVRR